MSDKTLQGSKNVSFLIQSYSSDKHGGWIILTWKVPLLLKKRLVASIICETCTLTATFIVIVWHAVPPMTNSSVTTEIVIDGKALFKEMDLGAG